MTNYERIINALKDGYNINHAEFCVGVKETLSDPEVLYDYPAELACAVLANFEQAANLVDELKKAAFYDRNREQFIKEHHAFFNDVYVNSPEVITLEDNRLLHGILGVCSEAGELVKPACDLINHQPVDEVNVFEEMGDFYFYLAVMLMWLSDHSTEDHYVEQIWKMVLLKLNKRYQGKQFTTAAANNRDLVAERAVLQSSVAQ